MLATRSSTRQPVLEAPIRNRYFYGKLLDVYHFEMETQYHNVKRWLLNRLITGYGVVCGLDVTPGEEVDEIWIEPGVALDKWGREVIVDQRTGPITIPGYLLDPDPDADEDEDDEEDEAATAGYDQAKRRRHGEERHHHRGTWLYVSICYLECEVDPTPVFAGDCDTAQPCAPGTIRERFKVEFHRGRHPRPDPECLAPEVFPNDRLDYGALARFVTDDCPDAPDDPCIVLANIRLVEERGGHACDRDNVDITVRPIVYGNDLLFKLMLSDEAEEREARNFRSKG